MSVNTGMLADSAERLCERVCVSAALDEQWADLSPSQTLLIKAGNVCNLSKLWPKDFARRDVCFSVSMLFPHPARVVGLILPRLSLSPDAYLTAPRVSGVRCW